MERIPQNYAGFGFAYKARPAAHIEIRVGNDWGKLFTWRFLRGKRRPNF